MQMSLFPQKNLGWKPTTGDEPFGVRVEPLTGRCNRNQGMLKIIGTRLRIHETWCGWPRSNHAVRVATPRDDHDWLRFAKTAPRSLFD
jgi:hypothetical protein